MTGAQDIGGHFLQSAAREFRKLQGMGERAMEQLRDEELFFRLNADQNSIYVIVKHLSGNMVSRWTDFLTTDGEKPGRHRDDEFVEKIVPRAEVEEHWRRGWGVLFASLGSLTPADVMKSVTIRGEAHTVIEAIHRQIQHVGYHTGQIVLLAKHIRGKDWHYLTIPRGESEAFNRAMREKRQ